jgi:hypothetical protein
VTAGSQQTPPELLALFRAFASLVGRDISASVSARPLPDGTIRIRFGFPESPPCFVDLLASNPGPFGRMTLTGESGLVDDPLRTAIEAACRTLETDARFAPMRLAFTASGPLDPRRPLMDTILARRLELGRSRCAGFTFRQAGEDPFRGCELVFEDRDQAVSFLLAPPTTPGTGLTAGPFSLFIESREPGGPPLAIRSESAIASLPARVHSLIDCVRFLLARSLPPGIRLVASEFEAYFTHPQDGTGDATGNGPLMASTAHAGDAWRRFFLPFEAERDLVCVLPSGDAWGRMIHLMHGELECSHIQPMGPDRVHFHRPLKAGVIGPADREEPRLWRQLLEAAGPPAPAPAVVEPTEAPLLPDTDLFVEPVLLGDREVIQGATGILSARLRELRAHAREGDIVVFNETCLPRIMGEDVGGALREHLAEGGPPILDIDISQPGPLQILERMVLRLRDLVRARLSAGDATVLDDGVALVGYPEDGSREELVALLRLLGLRVTGAFLPTLGRDGLHAVLTSRFVVCHPGDVWTRIVRDHLAGPDTRVLVPELPYGFDGVRRFLRGIAAEAGTREEAFAPMVDRLCTGLRVPVEPPAGLGFIVDVAEAERLVSTGTPFGIPVVAFLQDLGFPLTVFLYDAGRPGTTNGIAARLRELGAARGAVATQTFSTPADLRQVLSASEDVRVVCSQMTFDRRLLSCGKAAFSWSDLECGLWGAHRTAHRLLDRCRWRGPRRFGPFLAEKGWNA